MLDDEQRHAVGRQGAQQDGQGGRFRGVQARGRLVQEEGVRGAGEGSGEFGAAQGAGGEAGRGAGVQVRQVQEAQRAGSGPGSGTGGLFRADLDVLRDRQGREDRQLLEGAGHAEARTGVGGEPCDVVGAECDAARVGAQGAGQAVEEGALARAVGADDRGDVASGDGEVTSRSALNRRR